MGKPHLPASTVESQRAKVLDRVVKDLHASMLHTAGIVNTPSKTQIREGLKFFFDEILNHPESEGVEYFQMGGYVVRVERRHDLWDNFTLLVPATANMIWYRDGVDEEPED